MGSSPDHSRGMDLVNTADTFDVGGHAAGQAGAVDIEETDAQEDNHRTLPK